MYLLSMETDIEWLWFAIAYLKGYVAKMRLYTFSPDLSVVDAEFKNVWCF